MKLKKIVSITAIGVVIAAMTNNLTWALNDYGLKDVSLNRAVISQGQEPCTTRLANYDSTTSTKSGGTVINGQQYYQFVVSNVTRTGIRTHSEETVISGNTSASIGVGTGTASANISAGASATTKVTDTDTYSYHQRKVECNTGTRFYPCSPFWADI